MKRFTDDTDGQPASPQTGWLIYHLIKPIDSNDDVEPVEDDPCWNLTLLESHAEQPVKERD